MDREKIDLLKEFATPHIAITLFKFRAKGIAVFKEKNLDITIDQYIILRVLSQFPDITQNELCEMLYKDKSNFSRMAEDLESKGYLIRIPDLKEKRMVKRLRITETGKKLADKVTPLVREIHDSGIRGISREELDTLKSVLAKIRANLENQ